jgi:hypothetical protein
MRAGGGEEGDEVAGRCKRQADQSGTLEARVRKGVEARRELLLEDDAQVERTLEILRPVRLPQLVERPVLYLK